MCIRDRSWLGHHRPLVTAVPADDRHPRYISRMWWWCTTKDNLKIMIDQRVHVWRATSEVNWNKRNKACNRKRSFFFKKVQHVQLLCNESTIAQKTQCCHVKRIKWSKRFPSICSLPIQGLKHANPPIPESDWIHNLLLVILRPAWAVFAEALGGLLWKHLTQLVAQVKSHLHFRNVIPDKMT